jgi:hypothetical protein
MATATARGEGSIQVPEFLQVLIDSRLDTIDRMLLGRLPRAERLEVVREVESQVFELLQGRSDGGEVTRDDVLDALRRLDPPEAYLPEEFGSEPGPRPTGAIRPRPAGHPVPTAASPRSPVGLASFLVGIGASMLVLFQLPVLIAAANIFSGNATPIYLIYYAYTVVVAATAVTAIGLAGKARLGSGWAIAGLVIGILAGLGCLAFAVLGLFL